MRKFMKTAMAGTLSLAMVLGVTGVAAPEASAAKVKVKKVAVTSPSGKSSLCCQRQESKTVNNSKGISK